MYCTISVLFLLSPSPSCFDFISAFTCSLSLLHVLFFYSLILDLFCLIECKLAYLTSLLEYLHSQGSPVPLSSVQSSLLQIILWVKESLVNTFSPLFLSKLQSSKSIYIEVSEENILGNNPYWMNNYCLNMTSWLSYLSLTIDKTQDHNWSCMHFFISGT